MSENNPFFSVSLLPYQAPRFDLIDVSHYRPAFDEGVRRQRAEIAAIVNNLPPGQPDSPGRGDQRFFRIQIVSEQHYHSLIILIPEDRAPDSLVELWRDGEGCVSDKD